MKQIGRISLILTIIACLISCKKDSTKPTQKGANKMAANINGVRWEKKACFSCIAGGEALDVNYDDRTFFGISGENLDSQYTITIIIENLKNPGEFVLGNGKGSNTASNYAIVYPKTGKYYTSSNTIGKVTITKLDPSSKIITGTFEFTAENENNPSDVLTIKNGWFDVTYE